ncbi:MAG: M48 family metallopeptidase [Bacteroidales bacterium]|nr:M48 family metallopeptidase [Bacteroidales bacterium]
MKYVGLQSQIWKNNTRSVLLLIMFPIIFYALTWLFFYLTLTFQDKPLGMEEVNMRFLYTFPWITSGVLLWFLIAWFTHSSMIRAATQSRPLERKENKRVYNLVENLSIAAGMKMPAVNVIEDDSLNAFASGIDDRTYTISLSRGIIEKLNDEELEAVIAHELTHIRNRDVRLLIISIVFVGIFSFIAETLFRSLRYGSLGRSKKGNSGGAAMIIALVLALVGYLVATLIRFAISRKREYLADAGAAELTKNPRALASALRKVSGDPTIEAVKRADVAQMFIENPQIGLKKEKSPFATLFATHPPIKERIRILEQF